VVLVVELLGVKMKVISQPDYKTWQKQVNCYQCGSVICGDYSDLKYECIERTYCDERDYDSYKYKEDHYYFVCPVCEYKITVQGALPYLLKKFILGGKK